MQIKPLSATWAELAASSPVAAHMAADRSLVIGKRWSGTVIASSVLGQRPSTLYIKARPIRYREAAVCIALHHLYRFFAAFAEF